jgi:trigger factor
MQVSVENTGALERRLTVQVPAGEIQEKVDSKLQEISKQVRIKGFRPGRVPMSVVRQRYGKQVREDVLNETMQSSLQQAIQDEELRPASLPRLDGEPADSAGGDLEFSALVEVYPELGTLDVSELEISSPDTEVTADDVDDMLRTLREQRRSWEPVERTPETGDQVLIEYVAETAEGRVPEQGKQRLAVIIGESGFEELEKALGKLSAGEEKAVKLTFPMDYREPAVAGKDATVEVDDEFVSGFGITEGGIETLREEIKANLERELKQASNSMMKLQVIDGLVETMPDLEVPESIVREEAANLAAQAAAMAGIEPEPGQIEVFMDQARKRVRGGLLMGELAQQNSIRLDGARVRGAIETIADTYEQPDEVVQMYYGNQRLLQQVESSVLEEQVVDWVLENAKVSPKEMKFQDVISSAAQGSG